MPCPAVPEGLLGRGPRAAWACWHKRAVGYSTTPTRASGGASSLAPLGTPACPIRKHSAKIKRSHLSGESRTQLCATLVRQGCGSRHAQGSGSQ